MTFFRFQSLALVALGAIGALAARADVVGYTIDVTTNYAFGCPVALINGCSAGPDSGYFTVTNNGTTTFNGTVSDVAVSNFGGDFTYTTGALTLNPGDSLSIGIGSESSNVGGFNAPYGTLQPGVQINLNGNFNGVENVILSLNDADIHSGVPRTNPYGVVVDSYVLQGGDPYGNDTGDGFETTQAPGQFEFSEAPLTTPEPGSIAFVGAGISALFVALRRRRK